MAELAVGGTRVHFLDEGPRQPGGGGAIFFGHGLLWSGEMFRPQIDALQARHRCVAIDWRGQGRSAVAASGYDMDTLADDAAALIEHLGIAPCHFVGLSMGGFVGMRLAARRPELVRSLVLIATAADAEPRRKVLRYALLSLVARTVGLSPVVTPVMQIMFGGAFLADPARAAEQKARRAELAGVDRVGAVRATWGVITRRAVEAELGRITVPTLVLSGSDDRAVLPARARRTAAAIAGARFVAIERAGHTATLEEPAAVTAALGAFLGER